MQVIIFIFVLIIWFTVPFLRFLPSQLHNIVYYLPTDIFRHIKYKRGNECPAFGFIKIFNGYFGSGKSLSAVDEVVKVYRRYNGLPVWDDGLQAFVNQKITIISNLDLRGVPYIPFVSEQQFIDYETVPGEVVLFLVDEIGTVWNNRNFKSFNPDVFNNIVQSRKRKMAIFGTLPVFAGTDINIRRYTDTVVFCSKTWRFIKHLYFSAADLENCSDVEMLQPLRIRYIFVKDRMYKQYNTNAMIDKLKKDMQDGQMLTYKELNVNEPVGDFKQARLKKKYKKRQQ